MDNSWVKLYRKIADHDVFFDNNGLRVFIWLLTIVDKKTGIAKIGRSWGSTCVKLKEPTFYKVLKRLEKKYKIVTTNSNNQFTEVSLLNWAKYQAVDKLVSGVGNNEVTTKYQPSNTIQEYRIKNKRERGIRNTKDYLLSIPLEDIQAYQIICDASEHEIRDKGAALHDWLGSKGKQYKNYYLFLRGALRRDYPKNKSLKYTPGFEMSESMGYIDMTKKTKKDESR